MNELLTTLLPAAVGLFIGYGIGHMSGWNEGHQDGFKFGQRVGYMAGIHDKKPPAMEELEE